MVGVVRNAAWLGLVGALGLLGCPGGGGTIVLPGDDDATGDDDDDDDDSTPVIDEVQVEDVDWRLHTDLESLVYVRWTQTAGGGDGHVEYRFDDDAWLQTPSRALEEGDHEVLLLGVPYATELEFRVVNDFGDGPLATDVFGAATGALPSGLPVPTVITADADRWEPTGRYLLGSINQSNGGWTGGDYWKFIVDRNGRFVWAQLTPQHHWTIYMRVARDGTALLWDEATYWSNWDEGANSKIHRTKLDGTVVATYDTPGLHHAFTELDDGTLVWGAADWYSETLETMAPDGTRDTLWDCWAFHNQLGIQEGCQSNALYWHEDGGTFLYSFYTTSTVVELDVTSGQTIRWWGHLPGAWDFSPSNAAFWWQHGVSFTDEGHLLLSTHRTEWSSEAVAREYELDEADEVLHEVWSFGAGQGVDAETAGEAHRLPGGNTLHNYGSGSRIREVTADGDVVWDLDWTGSKLLGRTVYLEDLYPLGP